MFAGYHHEVIPVADADLVSPSPLLLPVELVEVVETADPGGRFVLSTLVETGLAKSISSSDLSPRPGPENIKKLKVTEIPSIQCLSSF